MKASIITALVAAAAVGAFFFLTSCEGLTVQVNPDGSIGGSYQPPVKPVVEQQQPTK